MPDESRENRTHEVKPTRTGEEFVARHYHWQSYGGHQRDEVYATVSEDLNVEVFVDAGDTGGRGAERHSASIILDAEQARALVEYLAPRLYG